MRRRLSLACWDYDRTAALADGRVCPQGIDLTYLVLPVEETFFRMARHGEFDVAELSLSTYVLSLSRGRPFVALPVFPSRAFRHSMVYVNAASSISAPAELRGGVVGVPEYQVTAAVWLRGILAEHHGLPVEAVRYRTGGLRQPGRIEKLGVHPPGVEIRPIEAGATLEGLLEAGKIDALYSPRTPAALLSDRRSLRRLWAEPRAEEIAYFRSTGIFPIMHTVVLRREVYEADRWIAGSLTRAFCEAKALAEERLEETAAHPSMLPWGFEEARAARELMGSDYYAYGLEANRANLSKFLRYSAEQGLAERLYEPEELFAPEATESYSI